jgi:hypothetical protein
VPPALIELHFPTRMRRHGLLATRNRTTAALEIRLRAPASFHENTHQFVCNWNQKRAPEGALFLDFPDDLRRIRGESDR